LSSRSKENGARANFHYDSNGNIVLLTDPKGQESARYAYDAFGKTMLATGSMAQANKYRFSTKPVEEASGLCFYGYRFYAPELGRWPSRDPIGDQLITIEGSVMHQTTDDASDRILLQHTARGD
jgi:RHS repeat-associated protein